MLNFYFFIVVGGILSPNPEENPFYWNVNHVFIPYCTSDSWSGTRMTKEGMFTFMGSLVVQQVSDLNDVLKSLPKFYV